MTVLALHDEGDIRPTAGSSCCGLFPVVCPLPLLAAQEALGHVPGKFVSQFEQGRLLACSLSVRKGLEIENFSNSYLSRGYFLWRMEKQVFEQM